MKGGRNAALRLRRYQELRNAGYSAQQARAIIGGARGATTRQKALREYDSIAGVGQRKESHRGKIRLAQDIQRAQKLGRDFSGHTIDQAQKISIPDAPKVALAIGEVLGIIYCTKREGVKENYIHHFNAASRPLLASTPDGKQLLLLGGAYDFTERGIVDRKRQPRRKPT